MGDAYRRIGCVDVLATSAGRAIGVDANIGFGMSISIVSSITG